MISYWVCHQPFFFLFFSQGTWNGRIGCTNGDLYTSGTHRLSHTVGIGGSFIGHKLAGGWISWVAVFSAEAKRLKLCHVYVCILRNTENITLSFNSLSICEVILLETQEILENLLRNYHRNKSSGFHSQGAREGQCKSQVSYGVCQQKRRKIQCIIRRPYSFLSGPQIRFKSRVEQTLNF